ncbi:MAG: tetratricopeptide repeat protein [Lysobacterales bacterium]
MSADPLVQAEQAFRQGDLDRADGLAAHSPRPDALQFRAMLAIQSQRLDQAREHMSAFLSQRPDDPNGWFNMGLVCKQLGDLSEAEKAYGEALRLAPDHPAANAGMIELIIANVNRLLGSNNPSAALKLLESCHNLTSAALWDARAAVLNSLGDNIPALAAARKALELAPDNLRITANLAALLSSQTNPEALAEAIQLATQVLSQRPDHGGANHCLAVVLQKQGELETALVHANRAVQVQPSLDHCMTAGDIQSLLNPQRGARMLGDAAEQMWASQKASPDCATPEMIRARALLLRQRGVALLRANQPGEALAVLDESLDLDPADQRTIAHRGVAMAITSNPQEANRWLGISHWIHREILACPAEFESLGHFNAALANDISEHSLMRWEPLGLAARNGGLTDNLLADNTLAIGGFERSLRAAINKMIASGPQSAPFDAAFPGTDYQLNIWATLVHADGNIDTHIHEESWLSGAYYVQLPAGQGDEGGIEFGRPHADLPQANQTECEVMRPSEGELLLFPSYLFHRTLAHQGVEPRISISFDVSKPPG